MSARCRPSPRRHRRRNSVKPVEAARPLLVNGIEDVISRPDLADRSIFLTLAPIGKQERRSEGDLWHEFASVQPRILAGLLDAAAPMRAEPLQHLNARVRGDLARDPVLLDLLALLDVAAVLDLWRLAGNADL